MIRARAETFRASIRFPFEVCPKCGHETPVLDDGTFAVHGGRDGECAGSGEPCAS